MNYLYFNVNFAIKEHDYIIQNSGGLMGIINKGQLEATLDLVQNDGYYNTIEEKASYLFYAINKNHCFQDGNKRASIALTAYFLELNGLGFIVGKFIRDMENIAVDVANNIIDRDLLFEIIQSFIYEQDYSEGLKLKIFNAKSC